MFGPTELIIVLVIVLIIFGAGKLPKVMGDLGKGVKSFKSAMNETEQPTAADPSKAEASKKDDAPGA